jgi:hypothetical protein
MRRAIAIGVAAAGVVLWTSSCEFQSTYSRSPNPGDASVGELQIDVREETRLTEGVRSAVVELVPASNDDWRTPLRHVAADTSGRATMGDLAPAHYSIRVWAAGYDTVTQHVRVKAGKIDAVRIALRDDRCKVVVTSHGPVCT